MATETPRILAVEDESVCRLHLRALLEPFRVELTVAGSAEEALGLLDRYSPDLILMDVILPEMDGLRAIERIRRRSEQRSTPIVVTSSLNDTASRIEARVVGASAYLPKPIDPLELAAVLQRFLGLGDSGWPVTPLPGPTMAPVAG